jgi:hypothetical protein
MTDETTTVDDAQDSADFDAGFEGKPAEPATKKPEPAETPREEVAPAPEYVQVTAKEWAEIKAVAAKTASYDQQLSRLFGTTGNIQKLLNESKAQAAQSATPTARKVELPKDAFAQMEKDFPELAQQTRAALEAALSGIPGRDVPEFDVDKLKDTLRQRELEILEEDHPDWAQIVGQVAGPNDKPDPDNAFRKWLATKDAAYQTRINHTMSPPVIARAIRLFQSETRTAPKVNVTPRNDARADRIRSAVQPKGDNAVAPPGKSVDDEFEAGFNSR